MTQPNDVPASTRKWRRHRKDTTLNLKPSEKRKLRLKTRTGAEIAQAAAPVTPRAQRAEKRSLKEQRRRDYNGTDDTLKLLHKTMEVVSKSQKSFKDVYLDGGPCPSTLAKWAKDGVRSPKLMTVLGALQACGNLRIAIIDDDGQVLS